MSFTLATHNVRRGAASLRRMASVVCWQEVSTIEAHRRLRNMDGYAEFVPGGRPRGQVPPKAACPISWRRQRWRLVDSGYVHVHGGQRHLTPSRGITWVVLRRRGARGRRLVVVNVWPVNGAWKPRKWPGTLTRRKTLWQRYMDSVEGLLVRLGREYPTAEVVVAGDFNWPTAVDLPGLKSAWPRGIDQIHFSSGVGEPRGTRVLRKVRKRIMGRYGSDHRARKIWLKFYNRPGRALRRQR